MKRRVIKKHLRAAESQFVEALYLYTQRPAGVENEALGRRLVGVATLMVLHFRRLLERGNRDCPEDVEVSAVVAEAGAREPEFFTLPASFIRQHHDATSSWEKVRTRGLDLTRYERTRGFEQIAKALDIEYPAKAESGDA